MRIRRPIRWRLFLLRLVHVNLGLALFGFAVALQLRAGVGLGPWDVFHEGVALRTPLTIGQAMIGAGFAMLAFSALVAKVRPGLGAALNMLLIGNWVDGFLRLPGFPTASGWLDGAAMFGAGLVLNGVATGLYLTAGLGAGPRDGFALALAKLLQVTVRRARTLVEVVVVASGWLLGGTVGAGTLVFALAIGPLMQSGLRVFRGLDAWYARQTAAGAPVGIRTEEARTPPVSSP
ncbi:MAG: hypothetical protein O3A02_00690 [bacterium]|nr:hypothetical protein [bacterium]